VAVISVGAVYYFGFYLRQSDQILLVGGSSTVMRYASALGDGLMKQRGDITVVSEGGGSTPALIAIKNQAIDVAVVSRELTDDEDDEYTSSNLIARDAIGFFVSPDNPVKNLTSDQLRTVFTGEVHNWSQLGGADMPVHIVVCGPETKSSEALSELLLDGAEVDGAADIAENEASVQSQVAADPSAIGCAMYLSEPESVRALSVNGVPLSRETVLSDRYPLSRSVFLVIHDLAAPERDDNFSGLRQFVRFFNGDDEQSLEVRRADAIRSYITFATSSEGQAIVEAQGALRVN
jgi:phosphate transport system substrate-binding protein